MTFYPRKLLFLLSLMATLPALNACAELEDEAPPQAATPAPDGDDLRAALTLCRERSGDFDFGCEKQLDALDIHAPSRHLARKCLYVEMMAALPQAEQADAAPAMAKFAREASCDRDGFFAGFNIVPAWLSSCPAQLGAEAWASAWRFASVDLEVHDGAPVGDAPLQLLTAICADADSGYRVLRSSDPSRGRLAAFAPRLVEASLENQAGARWPLLEMLARLWIHSDEPARQRLVLALHGAGEALWPGLAAWRDALDAATAPPPATLSRSLAATICDFHCGDCVGALLDGLGTPTAPPAARRHPVPTFNPLPPGHHGAPQGADVWDADVRGESRRSYVSESPQSIMSKEDAAQRSAERLLRQFDLTPSQLDDAAMQAIEEISGMLWDIEAGRRSSDPLRAAHPDISASEQLRVARMVLEQLGEWARHPRIHEGNSLLGHRGVSLAVLAIARFDREPDAAASTDPARDKSMMTQSLLRNLAEAVNGGPRDGGGIYSTVCFRGTGTRAIRSLQGYFRAVAVDTDIVGPVDFLGTLGEVFLREHPEPTPSETENFLRDSREAGRQMYMGHPAHGRAFAQLLQDYEESLR